MPGHKVKLAFLFNHEALHQAAHSAPVLGALLRRWANVEIDALFSSQEEKAFVAELLAAQGADLNRCRQVMVLDIPKVYHLAERFFGQISPFRRIAVLRSHLPLFREYDALVVPERTSLLLKTRFGLTRLKLIHTRHGAGDRSESWRAELRDFDFILLSGTKARDRLLKLGHIREGNYAVIGYPKFDAVDFQAKTSARLFANSRPTVLYAPHFDPTLSSWYDLGPAILDYFVKNQDFNLVFAPHPMLFHWRLHVSLHPFRVRLRPNIPEKASVAPNIKVDLSSAARVDMTYTLGADIYLGDVSSQVYEFLWKPRPCIFVNAQNLPWRDNPDFLDWTAGPVISSLHELDAAMSTAMAMHDRYRKTQEDLFRTTFDLTDRPSSERAADAILQFLNIKNVRLVVAR